MLGSYGKKCWTLQARYLARFHPLLEPLRPRGSIEGEFHDQLCRSVLTAQILNNEKQTWQALNQYVKENDVDCDLWTGNTVRTEKTSWH